VQQQEQTDAEMIVVKEEEEEETKGGTKEKMLQRRPFSAGVASRPPTAESPRRSVLVLVLPAVASFGCMRKGYARAPCGSVALTFLPDGAGGEKREEK
jgi:hypothetical protein